MFKTKLPYDYARCHGSSCIQREGCLRYTSIEADKRIIDNVRIGYSDALCYNLNNEFSGCYKIESECNK
jgi:hypothetical protein